MAERKEGPDTIDTYNPFFTERRWTPFYKRNVFTGVSQADQAANLVTSPSFTRFWSGGGEQADNTSLVRVNSAGRERNAVNLQHRGKYDVDFRPTPNPFPSRPVPPAGIRPIKWVDGIPELLDPSLLGLAPEQLWNEGGFRPDKFADIWPQLSPEEQAWWDKAIREKGGWNDKYLKHGYIEGKNSNVPSILQNQAGSLTRADRLRLTSMVYHVPDTGTERWINASSPNNLLGVSSEFSNAGMSGTSDFKPMIASHGRSALGRNTIDFLSTTSPDVALSVDSSRKLMDEYQLRQLLRNAVDQGTNKHFQNWGASKNAPLIYGITEPEIPVVGLPSEVQAAERRAGNIRRVGSTQSLPNGQPQTVIYGPPVKGMGAEVALNNTLHYGGKAAGLVGAVSEGLSIPRRRYEYINQMRAQSGLQPLTEPYDVNRFPDAPVSDLVKAQGLATGEAFVNFLTGGIADHYLHPEWEEPMEPVQRGYYSDAGQRVPNWVPNLQSTYQRPPDTYQDRPSFEKIGARFNNMYNKGLR